MIDNGLTKGVSPIGSWSTDDESSSSAREDSLLLTDLLFAISESSVEMINRMFLVEKEILADTNDFHTLSIGPVSLGDCPLVAFERWYIE